MASFVVICFCLCTTTGDRPIGLTSVRLHWERKKCSITLLAAFRVLPRIWPSMDKFPWLLPRIYISFKVTLPKKSYQGWNNLNFHIIYAICQNCATFLNSLHHTALSSRVFRRSWTQLPVGSGNDSWTNECHDPHKELVPEGVKPVERINRIWLFSLIWILGHLTVGHALLIIHKSYIF